MPAYARALLPTAVLLAAAIAGGCAWRAPPADARSGAPPDLKRFAGRWYVLAASAGFVDADAVGATVEYAAQPDGALLERRAAHPDAFERPPVREESRLLPLEPPRRWRVQSPWPWAGERRLLYADPGYRVALVVGDSAGEAQVLSREPELPEWTYAGLLARLVDAGYEVDGLRRVAQRPDQLGRPGFRD